MRINPFRNSRASAKSEQKYRVPAVPCSKTGEAELLRECTAWLGWQRGLWFVRVEAQVKIVGEDARKIPSAARGLSDLLICAQGRLFAAELKSPRGGELSDSQARHLAGIGRAGGRGAVVQSLRGLERFLTGGEWSRTIETDHGVIPVFF